MKARHFQHERRTVLAEWSIGIDIGGTFTDLVALDYAGGKLHSLKLLTTYDDPSLAVMEGVRQLMATCGIAASEVGRVVHATTLFTNALISRAGARTGLLCNQGFMDAIEIGNERKYDLYDLAIDRPPPLVPRDLRREIPGRLDAHGNELEPLDRQAVVAMARSLADAGATSIAVCLLHAYASPRHEQQVHAWIRQALPDVSLTLSSEVAPVIREFERGSTTVANAYIKPLADRYLAALEDKLATLGLRSGVLMMLSNGGLGHLRQARRNPIELLESGPAGGAIAAAHYGVCDQQPDLLAFDMGGTTAKLTLVEGGAPSIAHSFEAARRKRFAEGSGLPIGITTVHLIEIGAGGGSIAHQDELQLLKVGPLSAGSEPGPACYALGGEAPTVTDANLLLGYLNPDYFAGGSLRIDKDRAHVAVRTLARQLDRETVDVAWGIHDIVAENMAGAARVHLAECGRDAGDFVLLCTGGGGPLHAYYVAQKIGVRSIICPPAAGVASAYGLLIAPARADRSRTANFRPETGSLADLEREFAALEAQAREPLELVQDRFGPIEIVRHADGRFIGQAFNLSVRLPAGPYDREGGDATATRTVLVAAFKQAYEQKFGRTPPNVPVELVNLRVAAEAPPRVAFVPEPLAGGAPPEPKAWRQVFFKEADDFVRTPVYDRAALTPGFRAAGPALVEDAGSTLVVGPKGALLQLASGNIRITIEE
ncbi:hydantoinase/oxoprolinase family protein [Bordetella bronchiseptica]|uniref:hydantoinase/oxoprolinase family protein n=1 Tax=Bordetella bronchiseptica TaxID=518 RepID=UPI00028F9119|nr:hydantoinase/oxoprolinase family protein [Bordetella bronchiseptica]AUL16509.1 hydantoinase [Bordetella bronchiseptica]AWP59736.1 hydantoinase [Bordetella bronchiseptica]QIX99549.1 hydantoinase/oxoprolinase family protein [Bordetella bronchiseptica]CCN17261.1 putative hydantoinase A [Bordetella bronchiseptica MO211]